MPHPRTIAIGDVHGCIDALDALLAAIEPTADDCIVALGDYIDRGPDARAAVQRLSCKGGADWCRCLAITTTCC